MHLSTDAIDELRAAAVNLLDKDDDGLQLRIGAVETARANQMIYLLLSNTSHLLVIVDVELGVRVCSPCRLESDGDEALTKDVVEDRRAEGSVLVEDLVADVLQNVLGFMGIVIMRGDTYPRADLALEMAGDVGDMVLDDRGQSCLVIDVRDLCASMRRGWNHAKRMLYPSRKLGMPHCEYVQQVVSFA